MKHTLKPNGNRVAILPNEQEIKTASGLYIPETAKQKPTIGMVVAIGNGKYTEDGKIIPMWLKEGDTVVFSKYTGLEFELEGTSYLIMHEHDVLARIDELKVPNNMQEILGENEHQ